MANSENFLLHISLWYKKNKKLKQKNRALQRQVINLKYNILMKNPWMAVGGKKGKTMKLDVLAKLSKEMQ